MHLNTSLCTLGYLLCWSDWVIQGFGILAMWVNHSSYRLESWIWYLHCYDLTGVRELKLKCCWIIWLVSGTESENTAQRSDWCQKADSHRCPLVFTLYSHPYIGFWILLNSDPLILSEATCNAMTCICSLLTHYMLIWCLSEAIKYLFWIRMLNFPFK